MTKPMLYSKQAMVLSDGRVQVDIGIDKHLCLGIEDLEELQEPSKDLLQTDHDAYLPEVAGLTCQ